MQEQAIKKDIRTMLCKMTTPEFRKHKQNVLTAIKAKMVGKEELQFGFRYHFDGTDATLGQLVEFIKAERVCCDFLSFGLGAKDQSSLIFLSITGYHGAKEFIVSELGF